METDKVRQRYQTGNRQHRTDVSNGKLSVSDGHVKREETTSDGHVKQEMDNVRQTCQIRNGQCRTDVSNGKLTASDGCFTQEQEEGRAGTRRAKAAE